MPNTNDSDVVQATANFPILDLTDFDITEKTIRYIPVKHVIENPKIKNAEAEENLKRAEKPKIGHDSIRLMKWICYYDRSYYENINYYDLMGSICKCNIDIIYE